MQNPVKPTFTPYQNETLDTLYEMLFCDRLAIFHAQNDNPSEPILRTIFVDTPDENALLKIADDRSAESRVRAMACTKLLEIGSQQMPNPELLGVIVEVALDGGLDALAAYGDGTARYLNYAENVIIWESPNEQSNALVDNLWHHSINVVNRIGPWDKPRMAPPETGMVRLSFLVSGQIYLGQGPMQPFFQDAMAGPVLHAATQLMQYLTETSLANK